jgi:hypothetical protein
MAIVDGIAVIISFVVTARAIDVKFMEIARAYTPSAISAAAMAAALLAWQRWAPDLGQALGMLVPVAMGALVYLVVLALADRSILAEVRQILPRRSRRA